MITTGHCAPRFSKVREAFEANFRVHDEIGADLALIVDGETVVDLRGGWRDAARTQPWTPDTVTNVWSATKGINGACFAMLADRGLMSYEDRVSRYWPEFGTAGKADITIGMLLSHQAGVSAFAAPATLADLLGGERSASRLAAQAPLWAPGTVAGYHGMTLGILSTALFKRIEGRSMRQFVAEEIASPFGLRLSIGLDPKDEDEVAEMLPVPPLEEGGMGNSNRKLERSNPIQYLTLTNPAVPGALANDAAWRAADLPSANGYSNARALASLYELLRRPPADGRRLAGPEAIAQATHCRFEGVDLVKGIFTRWSAGFWLNPGQIYGPNLEAFGYSGWGGSFAFADPVAHIAVAYTMNRMGDRFDLDPRRRGLIEAVYASI
jgi:CubicO group peptidase (beta-lactamase class C family)